MQVRKKLTFVVLFAVLVAGVGDAGAAKKKKKPAKPTAPVATSTLQSGILSSGAISYSGGKGTVVIKAVVGGQTGTPLTASGQAQPTGGSLSLTAEGRTLLRGCTVQALRAESTYQEKAKKKGKKGKKGKGKKAGASAKKKGKKKKKKAKAKTVVLGSSANLTKNFSICAVTPSENPTATTYVGDPIDTTNGDRCDFLDPAVCLQPWPNDYFTVADATTDTGRRLNLNPLSTPRNKNGVGIDPTDQNRADGFSPGNPIIVKVPEVQTKQAFANSGLVPLSDRARYADSTQPAVVINTDTGERHPIWAEVDVNPLEPDGSGNVADANIIIRPSENFDEGGNYIVALRNLRNASNQAVEPPLAFRAYRDRLITQDPLIENRRAKMEQLISTLQAAGIPRSTLYLAWDFTVASEESLSERALQIRDDALAELGDTTPGDGIPQGSAPTFTIETVNEFTPAQNANIFREVNGTLTDVPCYLNVDGCPKGSVFAHEPDGDITWNESFSMDVPFRCIIPRSAVAGGTANPAKPGTYGHGLLGEYTQVNGQGRLANEDNSIWCAVDWIGFSFGDLSVVFTSLSDMSNFKRLVDRMQQGFVNFHYLGRALIRPGGFGSDRGIPVRPRDGGSNR